MFMDLARKARRLSKTFCLAGGFIGIPALWLAKPCALSAVVKLENERRSEMNALHENSESDLSHLGPVLDEAIDRLGAADRTAILLRFFEHRDFRAIGEALGSNQDAAQKRVSRALEKLHSLFNAGASAFRPRRWAHVLSAQAVTAAPPGLALAIGGAAAASAATGGGIAVTLP